MKTGTKQRKTHARDAFKPFVEQFFKQTFGKLGNKQLSEGLTRFYVEEIHNLLHPPISADDFDLAFVDAGNDLGIDFIHRDDQTVLVLQSKYLGEGKSVTLKDIQHFQTVFDRLRDDRFTKNPRLAEAVADIDFDQDRFVLKFITLGTITGQARDQADTEPRFPSAALADRVEFHFLDGDRLTDELRNAKALASGIPGDCELVAAGRRGSRTPIIELDVGPYPSCVIVVASEQLVQLYRRYRDSLFTLNIRNYLGNTATNKLLTASLRDEPSHFYYYNNGIACLAEKLEVKDDRVIAKGLQVINGAQTLRALAKAASRQQGRRPTQDALILLRITQAATQYGAEGRFRDSIIRFNNTQNVIKASDFRSNDPIHADLKRRFDEHRWRSKKVVYLPKRTDPASHRGATTIPVEELAKAIYAFLWDPTHFSARTSFLFDESEMGGYRWVFGDGIQVWTTIPDAEFRLRSAIWWLSVAFGEQLRLDKPGAADNLEKASLERKWIPLFVARLVLERSYEGDGYLDELRKTYKGDWEFGVASVGVWFKKLYEAAKGILVYKYKEAASQPGFVHRNWMRGSDTISSLQNFVRTAPITTVKREGSS